jgi:mono/diheme cytochrome c family protein
MKRIAQLLGCLVLTALLLSAGEASAQRASKSAGREVARRICSECHAVERRGGPSPNLDAPNFRRIANARGMTTRFLSVEIRRAHEVMPNLNLTPDELRDVMAYVMSLRRAR